jgi:hypothetical protein
LDARGVARTHAESVIGKRRGSDKPWLGGVEPRGENFREHLLETLLFYCAGYIVAFPEVLIMYQVYHTTRNF